MYPFRKNDELPWQEQLCVLKPFDIDRATRSSNFSSDGIQYAYLLREDGRNYNHYSFFILPDGRSCLDCRHPLDVTHLGLTDLLCQHCADLREFNLNNPFIKQIVEQLKAYFLEIKDVRNYEGLLSSNPQTVKETVYNFFGLNGATFLNGENMDSPHEATLMAKNRLLTNLLERRPNLTAHQGLLSNIVQEDEILTHDLGWVKIVIMFDRYSGSMVAKIPNKEIGGREVTNSQLSTINQLAKFYGFETQEVMKDTLKGDWLITRELNIAEGKTPQEG